MYKFIKIRHDIIKQCHGNYKEMKKLNYKLETKVFRNSTLKKLVSWEVLFKVLGVQKGILLTKTMSLTFVLLVANWAIIKLCKKTWKMTETQPNGWEYSKRAFPAMSIHLVGMIFMIFCILIQCEKKICTKLTFQEITHVKQFGWPEQWFLRVWVSKYYPDALLAKTMILNINQNYFQVCVYFDKVEWPFSTSESSMWHSV